ncbi:hypothetical protein MHU86_6979 [Fragilaria crotonensis]|nr:hypothetical protein MHU86_6979 [Fragilaria crotonensis]
MTVVGFTMKPIVPAPAFIAAAIMEAYYVTEPEELAMVIIGIKRKGCKDPDPDRATIFCRGGILRPAMGDLRRSEHKEHAGPTQMGCGGVEAYSRQADEWVRALHIEVLGCQNKEPHASQTTSRECLDKRTTPSGTCRASSSGKWRAHSQCRHRHLLRQASTPFHLRLSKC